MIGPAPSLHSPNWRAEQEARAHRIAAVLTTRLAALGWQGITVEPLNDPRNKHDRFTATGTIAGETFTAHGYFPDSALYAMYGAALEVAEGDGIR